MYRTHLYLGIIVAQTDITPKQIRTFPNISVHGLGKSATFLLSLLNSVKSSSLSNESGKGVNEEDDSVVLLCGLLGGILLAASPRMLAIVNAPTNGGGRAAR